ncbi:hypothetical protein AOLI_G00044200 [Acnodon oligacanthus]
MLNFRFTAGRLAFRPQGPVLHVLAQDPLTRQGRSPYRICCPALLLLQNVMDTEKQKQKPNFYTQQAPQRTIRLQNQKANSIESERHPSICQISSQRYPRVGKP